MKLLKEYPTQSGQFYYIDKDHPKRITKVWVEITENTMMIKHDKDSPHFYLCNLNFKNRFQDFELAYIDE